jgi:cephalosporin hydroxylase
MGVSASTRVNSLLSKVRKSLQNTALDRPVRALGKWLFGWYFWLVSRAEVDKLLKDVDSPEKAVEITNRYRGVSTYSRLRAYQDPEEFARAALRIRELAPRVIVEIGTRDGGSLLVWTWSAPRPELVVSIDLPGGIHGGGFVSERTRLYRHVVEKRDGCRLEVIRADSQQESTRARLLEMLGGRPIDFLYIDGDHRYEGVRADYSLYANLVRPGGIIGFHDIRLNTADPTIQVYRLWDEIKASGRKVEEIIHEPYQGRFGIGLVTVES